MSNCTYSELCPVLSKVYFNCTVYAVAIQGVKENQDELSSVQRRAEPKSSLSTNAVPDIAVLGYHH